MQRDSASYGPAALDRNPVPAPGRPWRLAAGLLAGMGVLFFSSYGLANWLASQRAEVPYFHFGWERGIPFVPWTIVPYWSIDLLYGISFFLWPTRADLLSHAKRLLAAQLVSVACFVAFPLRFAFARPEADGLPGQLFTLLGGFDKPFNQAPSLHISLLVILWVAYAAHLRGGWRWLLHLWFALIGVSVLTTYQHHFIDIPTGWLAGWLCVFAFPREPAAAAGSPDAGLARRYGLAAALLALASVAALSVSVVASFLLVWAAIALGCVAMIYRAGKPGAFQKRADGTLPMSAWWVLWPYVLGAFANSRWWTRRQPAVSRLADGVWIGRLPGEAELRDSGADAVLDLTAELPRLVTGVAYRCVPVLDLTVPSQAQLQAGVEIIERWRLQGCTVLVSCALGYSRSALVAAAWLGAHARLRDPQQVLARLRQSRPAVVLGPQSVAALAHFLQTNSADPRDPDTQGAAHGD
ncbi:phosphatase PAP2/dual specificity phosphatase family protein [Cupriavidus sp. WKF15]|uniref:phosphatase PAP2/dual specificity phosphatase family protein n=1 Tax=Cupriavidus sp. WKF15 TaxID=3032282 RepID=UPI0023E2BDDB|nr:phosphatase PAP2/dual specificity phosphatase family protein [Cupriavidus sp. WKF15]WER48251.1 phosphatase PAP2/dual specificity phosphatase family protein [Cupriavidus sp. WKF15]